MARVRRRIALLEYDFGILLEPPYGNLMLESMGGPQARTYVRGNLCSFSMPWEDIGKCCQEAVLNMSATARAELQQIQDNFRLPHDEQLLATLLQVHINLGAGESEVSSPRGLRLDDLAWHDVRIERENADLQLTIDGIYKNR